MTNEDHEREQRAFWGALCVAMRGNPAINGGSEAITTVASTMLAELDKRFPVPIGGEP